MDFTLSEAPGEDTRNFTLSTAAGEGTRDLRFSETPGNGTRYFRVSQAPGEGTMEFRFSQRPQGRARRILELVPVPEQKKAIKTHFVRGFSGKRRVELCRVMRHDVRTGGESNNERFVAGNSTKNIYRESFKNRNPIIVVSCCTTSRQESQKICFLF